MLVRIGNGFDRAIRIECKSIEHDVNYDVIDNDRLAGKSAKSTFVDFVKVLFRKTAKSAAIDFVEIALAKLGQWIHRRSTPAFDLGQFERNFFNSAIGQIQIGESPKERERERNKSE